MYKVMLVDDEAVVREGLRTIIDWPSHGFELAGDYTNGRDALDAIDAVRPDLVLTDINMPFMNGSGAQRAYSGAIPLHQNHYSDRI